MPSLLSEVQSRSTVASKSFPSLVAISFAHRSHSKLPYFLAISVAACWAVSTGNAAPILFFRGTLILPNPVVRQTGPSNRPAGGFPETSPFYPGPPRRPARRPVPYPQEPSGTGNAWPPTRAGIRDALPLPAALQTGPATAPPGS